jgi:Lar family restriction alleviation protein
VSEYKQIALPHGVVLLPCPFCGSPAEINEFTDFGQVSKIVSCTNSGEMGESDECVMYFPSAVAYKATKREAIAIWNSRATVSADSLPHPSTGYAKQIDGII